MAVSKQLCTVPGCERALRARGMCATHYARWQKYGTTDLPPRPIRGETCSVKGCARKATYGHSGQELCNGHYHRLWRSGSVGAAELKRWRVDPTPCVIDGCDTATKDLSGYCGKHLTRVKRHGSPDVVIAPEDRDMARRGANARWSGDSVTYAGVHQRLRQWLGSASLFACYACGNRANQWAYQHCSTDERLWGSMPYSNDINDYEPMCASCHKRMDCAQLRNENGFFTQGTRDYFRPGRQDVRRLWGDVPAGSTSSVESRNGRLEAS